MASSRSSTADSDSSTPREMVPKTWNFTNGKLEVQELLGKGQFGSIFRVQHTDSKFIFAIETITKSKITKTATKIEEQLKAHQQLKHSNLLRLYGYFHDQDNIYLMLQYAPKGKLRDFLDVKGRLEEKEAAHLLVQVVKALQFLHFRGIVHTKVNPGNILMLNEKHILVKFPELSIFQEKMDKNAAIQLNYTAPEVLNRSRVTQSADIWSVGVLLFEMVCGSHLLDQEEATNFIIPAHVSERAMNLFPKLIMSNPEKRLPLKKILSHPWVKTNILAKNKEEVKESVQESAVVGSPRADDVLLPPVAEPAPVSQPKRRTFGGSLENRKNF